MDIRRLQKLYVSLQREPPKCCVLSLTKSHFDSSDSDHAEAVVLWCLRMDYPDVCPGDHSLSVWLELDFGLEPTKMPSISLVAPRLAAPFIHIGTVCMQEMGLTTWQLEEDSIRILISTLYESFLPLVKDWPVTSTSGPVSYTKAERNNGLEHLRKVHPTFFRAVLPATDPHDTHPCTEPAPLNEGCDATTAKENVVYDADELERALQEGGNIVLTNLQNDFCLARGVAIHSRTTVVGHKSSTLSIENAGKVDAGGVEHARLEVDAPSNAAVRFEGLRLEATVLVHAGQMTFRNCVLSPPFGDALCVHGTATVALHACTITGPVSISEHATLTMDEACDVVFESTAQEHFEAHSVCGYISAWDRANLVLTDTTITDRVMSLHAALLYIAHGAAATLRMLSVKACAATANAIQCECAHLDAADCSITTEGETAILVSNQSTSKICKTKVHGSDSTSGGSRGIVVEYGSHGDIQGSSISNVVHGVASIAQGRSRPHRKRNQPMYKRPHRGRLQRGSKRLRDRPLPASWMLCTEWIEGENERVRECKVDLHRQLCRH